VFFPYSIREKIFSTTFFSNIQDNFCSEARFAIPSLICCNYAMLKTTVKVAFWVRPQPIFQVV
jgi:hypothetical protein